MQSMRIPASEKQKAKWRAKYRADPSVALWANRKYKYGYSKDMVFRSVEAQGNKCPICQCSLLEIPDNKWHIDHDHKTGEVRGVLCFLCNHKLGVVEKAGKFNYESALDYLRKHRDAGFYSI
jgi:hypothetical protein